MEKEFEGTKITPRGVIFLALGGYTKEHQIGGVKDDAAKVTDKLIKRLGNNSAIVVIDGELTFVGLKT